MLFFAKITLRKLNTNYMAKKSKFFVFVLLTFLILGTFFYFYTNNGLALSKSQEEIVETLGRPDQFTITYLPQGESNLSRQETWFYLENKQKISFLNGEITSSKEINKDLTARSSSDLKSENFDFYVSLDEIKNMFEEDNLVLVDAPVFSDAENGVETYASSKALFIFEQGYLTYMETLD